MKAKVCFIGLGVMGFPMAGHLADAGYEVTVFNRTTEKSQLWLKKYSGKIVIFVSKIMTPVLKNESRSTLKSN